VLSFNFVKAKQQVGMKAIAHGADMPPDPAAVQNHGFIWTYHVFFQFGFEALSRLDAADIELVLEADQKSGSVGDGVGRSGRFLVVVPVLRVERHQRQS
jgi:hypothetical protein